MKQIKVSVKVLPEQQCTVLNYRCSPPKWEAGVCQFVDVSVNENGKTGNHYRVILDRKSFTKRYPWGRLIFVTVGDDGILTKTPTKGK